MSLFPFRNSRKGRPPRSDVSRTPSGYISSASDLTKAAVYVIEMPGAVKIGVSSCPTKRLANLKTGTRHDLAISWVTWGKRSTMCELEAVVHRRLKNGALHIKGEWYKMTGLHAARIIRDTAKEIGVSLDVSGVADEEPQEDDGVQGYGTHRYDWARVLIDEVGKS